MNTPNNKRYRDMTESINAAFASLLQNKELCDITVTDICEIASIERSTFYAHYNDVAALANDYAAQIEKQVSKQQHTEDDFSWLFEYIKEHPDLFKIYFKLGVNQTSGDYKRIFFRTGAYSVAKMWFEEGCIEPPEQMSTIIKSEYEKIYE